MRNRLPILKRSTPQFVKEVCSQIQSKGNCSVLCFDVKSFFDSISHAALKKNWIRVLSHENNTPLKSLPNDHFAIFKNVTNFSFVDKADIESLFPNGEIPVKNGRFLPNGSMIKFVMDKNRAQIKRNGRPILQKNKNHAGIPQGLPISGTLANISMLEFDQRMNELAKRHGGIYRRYSDDILFVINIGSEKIVEDEVITNIAAIELNLNPTKTERRRFEKVDKRLECKNANTGKMQKLQYLGIEFDGKYCFLRSSSISRFYRNLHKHVKRAIWQSIQNGTQAINLKKIYRRFTALDEDSSNFITYAKKTHRLLFPFSKINHQITDNIVIKKIRAITREKRVGST